MMAETAAKAPPSLVEKATLICKLVDEMASEIRTHRQRQISTFRESAIVQGLITAGVGRIGLDDNALVLSRILCGVACLSAAGLGFWIIWIYKKRIYYIRDQRNAVLAQVAKAADLIDITRPLYPRERSGLSPEYRTATSSLAYGISLLLIGVLMAGVNVIAAAFGYGIL